MTAITTDMFDANFSAINTAANAANGPVFLDASSKLPAVDGSLLTNVVSSPVLAAVSFNASGGAISTQRNVASVSHVSTGRYDIVFTSPLAVAPSVILAGGGICVTGAFNFVPDFVSTNGFRLYVYSGVSLVDLTIGSVSCAVLM